MAYGDDPSTALAGVGTTYYGIGYFNQLTATAGAASTSATAQSNVGSYGISTAAGAAASYTPGGASRIVYLDGTMTVNRRAITVTADNPSLTYTVGGSGLVNGDGLTGTLSATATTSSNVNSYGIAEGSLAASANYAVAFVGGHADGQPG